MNVAKTQRRVSIDQPSQLGQLQKSNALNDRSHRLGFEPRMPAGASPSAKGGFAKIRTCLPSSTSAPRNQQMSIGANDGFADRKPPGHAGCRASLVSDIAPKRPASPPPPLLLAPRSSVGVPLCTTTKQTAKMAACGEFHGCCQSPGGEQIKAGSENA
jgi:hypothetical protein